jgi:beta-xylosidase
MESGRIKTRPKFLRQSPIGVGIAEGSHIFRKDDYYYLITAEGGTETLHQEWVFRSKEGPYGPWEAGAEGVNPMVFQGQYPDEEIQYTGHMDLVDAPDGKWWAVMLGVREQRDGPKKDNEIIWSQLGRETFLCPVEWKDGWPVVNNRKPLRVKGEEGTGLALVPAEIDWRDDFDEKGMFNSSQRLEMPANWIFPRPRPRLVHRQNTEHQLLLSDGKAVNADDSWLTILLH